jgi:transketolase
MITLTPWDPNEVWPLLIAALHRRPAVIAPFVTRPAEKIFDRAALKLPPTEAAIQGIYAMRRANPAKRPYHGTVVLQGSGETCAFVEEVLPKIDAEGLNLNVYYVSSAELFDLLSPAERERIFPEAHAREAMGISGFTLASMYRFVTSNAGRAATLHAFSRGHYLGSGQAHKVLEEAGLNGAGQWQSILKYAKAIARASGSAPKTAAPPKVRPKTKPKAKPKAEPKSKPKAKPKARKSKGGRR